MASKVLVPTAPFAKLQLKKSTPPEQPSSSTSNGGSGFIIGGDAVARVAHLEHSVRFLQEQHRQMLSGLHSEIEALRERNRDLQFQLIFNKESSPKPATPAQEECSESTEEANLKREVTRLEREAAAARSEARAAEARALQLQRLLDAQTEKMRELESQQCSTCLSSERAAALSPGAAETRAELRARLSDAERLVRRLRADAERQRREVLAAAAGGAVTNLLFDGAAARHAHLQCMKNSLHASLRASGLDGYGYQSNYHFPPVPTPDFWREPLREDFNVMGSRGRSTRRPLTLPELSGQQIHRSTVYGNNHTRSRANGYEHKNKKAHAPNSEASENKSPEEQQPAQNTTTDAARPRARRQHHRKHAPDHT
ncbi:coiled-coil domain-containing protein 92-like isoform X3 [Ostrinia furnacalis]|uniref:coiled-coil domain-containing protein 92-like isoform X3 n=1 Tax=Ostrinia furnacalis TaxID=93504 RepID=UPI00103B42B1|nr:coiled-coil domain-containing protein 92-like isoform X3 [Ostrinia furnacalis]